MEKNREREQEREQEREEEREKERELKLLPPIFLHSCEIKSGSGLGTRL